MKTGPKRYEEVSRGTRRQRGIPEILVQAISAKTGSRRYRYQEVCFVHADFLNMHTCGFIYMRWQQFFFICGWSTFFLHAVATETGHRGIKIKNVTKVVPVRAVNLSTGPFCTEFRCEQLCDDDAFWDRGQLLGSGPKIRNKKSPSD